MMQIFAAVLLIIGYVTLLRGLILGKEKSINGFSFLIWGSLSLCLGLLASREASVDPAIQRFTIIMSLFQYLIGIVSLWKRQYKKINTYEILAVVIAAGTMTLWYILREQVSLISMGCIIVADICAIWPSVIEVKKSEKIGNDFIRSFALFGIVATLVVLGLETKNLQSLAYPVFEVVVNFGIMLFALYRRSHILRLA